MEYTKPWLSVEDQIEGLSSRGLEIGDRSEAGRLLREVGYYRLTGYLNSLRESERQMDDRGRERIRVLGSYRPGACLDDAVALIDFDRELRLLVLEGIERIEIALRMQLGYSLGKQSAFAHEDTSAFVSAFTAPRTGEDGELLPSHHESWLTRVRERQSASDD